MHSLESWIEAPLYAHNQSHSQLLTSQEAAAILSVPEGTLRQWRCAGKGPVFIKLGRKSVRYNRNDLAEFIRQGRQVPSVRAYMEEQ
jgi:hypothetical protein